MFCAYSYCLKMFDTQERCVSFKFCFKEGELFSETSEILRKECLTMNSRAELKLMSGKNG